MVGAEGVAEFDADGKAGEEGEHVSGLVREGEKLGTVRSVHAAAKCAAFFRSTEGALGQSGLSPIFRASFCLSKQDVG